MRLHGKCCSSGSAFVSGAGGLRSKFPAGKIENSVANLLRFSAYYSKYNETFDELISSSLAGGDKGLMLFYNIMSETSLICNRLPQVHT